MKTLDDLDPSKTAKELIEINFTSEEYENGVQAQRKRRLVTFEKTGISVLIEMEKQLIKFGEEVLVLIRAHENDIIKNKS